LIDFQNEVQKHVVDYLRTTDRDELAYPESTSVGREAIDRLIQYQDEGRIFLLVDIPTERTGTRTALEYLPEADRRDVLQDWGSPVALEDSVVWTNLHDSFLEAVGKIRVFADPNLRETIEAGVKKVKMTEIVEASVRRFL
jgi:hypothetical protein